MVGELLPFERFVVVNVDLLEQIDQVLGQADPVFGLRQVVEHNLHKLLKTEPLFLIFHEVLLDLLNLPVVKMRHDIVILILFLLLRDLADFPLV
jgi:hypothetical protein